MPSCRSAFASRNIIEMKMAKSVGACSQPCLTPFSIENKFESSPLCFTCPCWSVWGWESHSTQNTRKSVSAHGVKSLPQVREGCVKTHVLLPALLLNLAKYEDHICNSPVDARIALTFWKISSAIAGISLLSITRARILPAMERRVIPM